MNNKQHITVRKPEMRKPEMEIFTLQQPLKKHMYTLIL